MPTNRRSLKRYLFIAVLLFFAGMILLELAAAHFPRWLDDFSALPAPWPRIVNALIGGLLLGGWYTGGVFVTRAVEARHISAGTGALFNTTLYGAFLMLGPLTFPAAIVIALRRLLSGDLPETEEEVSQHRARPVVRDSLPRH